MACVQTHDQGCVLEPEFEALVEEIAGEYAEQSGFQNQWGLEAIGADEAYANLELQFGPDTAPGEGVIVGILDTGVDGEDPAFRNKTVIERFSLWRDRRRRNRFLSRHGGGKRHRRRGHS